MRGNGSKHGGRPSVRVFVTDDQEAELQRRVKAATTPQRDVIRAKILLAAAQGEGSSVIAKRLGVSIDMVSTWRGRFARHGLDGLTDLPRPGPHLRIHPIQRCEIIATACKAGPQQDGLNGWTLDLLREELQRREIVKVSRSHLHTILQRADLQPHKKKMWLHSPDPNFREKVTEVVELYLNPPRGTTVVSVDEKTGVQAIERKHPDKPARPGEPGRREFEYIRHGTQSLLAALIVRTGEVISRCGRTRKAFDLVALMEQVAKRVPGPVDVIWDNLNIHKGERWEKFNARHEGRFRFHYTPLHASWVNQIELWFGILQRRSLNQGSFTSEENLHAVIKAFVRYWNDKAKHPFRWSFTGYGASAQRVSAAEGKACGQTP